MESLSGQFEEQVTEALLGINEQRNEETLIIVSDLIQMRPELIELRYGKAVLLARLGKETEAAKELEVLMQERPNHIKALTLHDELCKESQSCEAVISLTDVVEEVSVEPAPQTISANPSADQGTLDVVNGLVDQALVLLKEGKAGEALQLLIRAKGFQTPARDLDYVRAICFLEIKGPNHLGEARQALAEELRHFPENSTAQELLDQVVAEQGDFEMSGQPVTGDVEFDGLLRQIRPYSMLPVQRLFALYQLAKDACERDVPGDFVECGVAGGGSTALLAAVIQKYSKRPRTVYACDSYEGMPAPSEHDVAKGVGAEASGWGTGTCAAPEDSVMKVSAELGVADLVRTVKGYFENTLPGLAASVDAVAFMHADADWYESTKTILNDLYDKVPVGGLIQLDDYGYWDGIKKAVDEFCAARGIMLDIKDIDGGSAWFLKK